MRRIVFLVLCLCLWACSVKEDRSGCPCELLIRPREALGTDGKVLVSVIQDGAMVRQSLLNWDDFEGGKCRLRLNRRPARVTVFSGITEMDLLRGRMLDIRSEHQCDAVYSCNDVAELQADFCELPVSLHKNYIQLGLTVLNMPDSSAFCVCGSVRGYDLLDSTPYKGSFICSQEDGSATGSCSLRLPRQLGYDLYLDLLQCGETLLSVPLGSFIEQSGYSFEDEDLMDITMMLDLQKACVWLRISDWEEVMLPIKVG